MIVAVYAPKWPSGSGKPPLTWVTHVTGTFQWWGASPGKGDCCSASNPSPNHGLKRLSREWPNSSRRWSPGYSSNQILRKLNHLLPVRDAGLLLGSKCSSNDSKLSMTFQWIRTMCTTSWSCLWYVLEEPSLMESGPVLGTLYPLFLLLLPHSSPSYCGSFLPKMAPLGIPTQCINVKIHWSPERKREQ